MCIRILEKRILQMIDFSQPQSSNVPLFWHRYSTNTRSRFLSHIRPSDHQMKDETSWGAGEELQKRDMGG